MAYLEALLAVISALTGPLAVGFASFIAGWVVLFNVGWLAWDAWRGLSKRRAWRRLGTRSIRISLRILALFLLLNGLTLVGLAVRGDLPIGSWW